MKLWNIYAKYYSVLRSNPISSFIQRSELKSIQKLLKLRSNISVEGQAVDLGTGRGACLKFIPPDIVQVFAIDSSAKMVALTSNEYKEVEVRSGPQPLDSIS